MAIISKERSVYMPRLSNACEEPQAVSAMAFYHPSGLVQGWAHACNFAGDGGRVATLPDIIDARIASDQDSAAWTQYYTTASSEFVGLSKGGTPVIAVAHGIGPMSSISGILDGYSNEYRSKNTENRRRGGRIAQEAFLKLLDGEFGDVAVVDLQAVLSFSQYPMMSPVTPEDALRHPMVTARLGKNYEAYIEKHAAIAIERRREQEFYFEAAGVEVDAGPILTMTSDNNVWYRENMDFEDGKACGHLLSIGQLCHVGRSENKVRMVDNIESDVSLHGWTDGVRFVGIAAEWDGEIHPGVDMRRAFNKDRDLLWQAPDEDGVMAMVPLVHVGDEIFSQHPKYGTGLDTGTPQYRAISYEPIGETVDIVFSTSCAAGLFKYSMNEIRSQAPQGANCYFLVGFPTPVDGGARSGHAVQFGRAEFDVRQQLPKPDDVYKNFDIMVKLASRQLSYN